MADACDELVDIGHLGVPGSHPADLVVMGVPIVEKRPLTELVNSIWREHGEDAVDLGCRAKLHAGQAASFLVQMGRHGVGVVGIFDPEVVAQ